MERDFPRVIATMAVNRTFKAAMLDETTRAAALKMGYDREKFDFTQEELSDVLAIKASNFKEFAQALDLVLKKHYPKTLEDILKNFPPGINF